MPDIITKKDVTLNQAVIGESSENYLDTLSAFTKKELNTLRKETLNIYNSFNYSNDTALVVGRIQSGKTTSFVNLSAIAHDNDVPLVIIIAGVSKTLTSQTFEETEKLSNSNQWRTILVSSTSDIGGVMSPKDKNFTEEVLNNIEVFDSVPKELKHSQLLVVMKEDDNLEHLTNALKRIPERLLNSTKTLIIDDEVDQYGLNSKISSNQTSTIYEKILTLLPVVNKGCTMNFYKWNYLDPLKINQYGIPEPYKNKKTYIPNIFLVPLLAFDISKNRLGYGKGYYDKFLNKYLKINRDILTIGVAFSFQKYNKLPISKNDVRLNYILTEKGFE